MALAIQPAGPDALAFDYTANLVAACPTFRTEVLDVVDFDAAKARIYWQENLADIDPEVSVDEEIPVALEPRPFAVVMPSEPFTSERVGAGEWMGSGAFFVIVEAIVPEEYRISGEHDGSEDKRQKFRARRTWGVNVAGRIREEMEQRSGGHEGEHPLLNARRVELAQEPGDPEEEEAEDYIGFMYVVGWR